MKIAWYESIALWLFYHVWQPIERKAAQMEEYRSWEEK
jgi:hypothetical protein